MPRKFTSKRGGSRKRGGARKTMKRRGGSRRRTGGKNTFFKTMLSAKKGGAKSFQYGGKTYHRHQKGGLVYYKA